MHPRPRPHPPTLSLESQNGIWKEPKLIVTGEFGIPCQPSCSCSSFHLIDGTFWWNDFTKNVQVFTSVASTSTLNPQGSTCPDKLFVFAVVDVSSRHSLNSFSLFFFFFNNLVTADIRSSGAFVSIQLRPSPRRGQRYS